MRLVQQLSEKKFTTQWFPSPKKTPQKSLDYDSCRHLPLTMLKSAQKASEGDVRRHKIAGKIPQKPNVVIKV